MNTPQHFHCPHCNALVDTSGEPAGQTIGCPGCRQPVVVPGPVAEQPAPLPPAGEITGRQVYNVVSDVGVGVNVRLSDNLLQLAAMGIGTVLGAVIGLLVGLAYSEPVIGAVAGGVVGFLVGFFGSGVFLMIYRLIAHLAGKHD